MFKLPDKQCVLQIPFLGVCNLQSNSFTNQTLAQIELWNNTDKYENQVYVLPKHLDEKVAALHLEKVGAKLTKLSKEQADYISVKQQGPFKHDSYRY